MTKRREPLTYQHTLTKVAAIIGWDRAAHICGVSIRLVRMWSEHETEREIRMIDAERLDRACLEHGADHAPFLRLFTLRLDVAARESACPDLTRAAGRAARESGEAISALLDAAAPGADQHQLRAARKEAEEAIEALTDGLAALARKDHAIGSEG